MLPTLTLSALLMAPGLTNPAVTQATIDQTICVRGWTKTVRPPSSYTTKLKLIQLRDAGLHGEASDYEEDHMIPLELGGHPTDPRNLWAEPWDGPNGAHAKDKIENKLHRKVCKGQMTLEEARAAMLKWADEHRPE